MATPDALATELKDSPVRRATVVRRGEQGALEPTVVYKEKSKRRVPKRWRGLEKFMRRMGAAQKTAADVYLERHERSNAKKKNGWLKDLGKNMGKARRQGTKKLKIRI